MDCEASEVCHQAGLHAHELTAQHRYMPLRGGAQGCPHIPAEVNCGGGMHEMAAVERYPEVHNTLQYILPLATSPAILHLYPATSFEESTK